MTGWTAIVPVKPWDRAKNRLDVPAPVRRQLARAFTHDVLVVLDRAPSVRRVVVVTTDPEVRALALELGAAVVAEPVPGLGAAVDTGRRWAMDRRPSDRVVVVPADLPALTIEVLEDVLAAAAVHRSAFVPDTDGDGTTLLMARSPRRLTAAYGPGSAARHREAGARELDDTDQRARRDVDTIDDLHAAASLGVGAWTDSVAGGPLERVTQLA